MRATPAESCATGRRTKRLTKSSTSSQVTSRAVSASQTTVSSSVVWSPMKSEIGGLDAHVEDGGPGVGIHPLQGEGGVAGSPETDEKPAKLPAERPSRLPMEGGRASA